MSNIHIYIFRMLPINVSLLSLAWGAFCWWPGRAASGTLTSPKGDMQWKTPIHKIAALGGVYSKNLSFWVLKGGVHLHFWAFSESWGVRRSVVGQGLLGVEGDSSAPAGGFGRAKAL